MGANSIQAGQAMHANFSTSYALTPDLRVGLGGYALRQLTEDKIDRVALRRSRERVIAAGSGTDVAASRHDAGRKYLYGVRRAQPA